MLLHTFCHIPGLGEKTEAKLWKEGITTWNEALTNPDLGKILPSSLYQTTLFYLDKSWEKLEKGEVSFFDHLLPACEKWRLFPQFRESTVFLDIETTGLRPPDDALTVVTLYDGNRIRTYINGLNLEDFIKDIMDYQIIVTFNGKKFDLPFIERYFGVRLPQAHLDLRFLLRSLGYRGGLKACEQAIGIRRGILKGIDGYGAVLLWQRYLEGCPEALETLIAYNVADTVNLEKLAVFAYNQKLKNLPFIQSPLPEPRKKILAPYHPRPEIIREITLERLRSPSNLV